MDERRAVERKRYSEFLDASKDLPDVNANRDELEMRRLGKKPVLKRNFNFVSLFAFSCTVLLTWESISITYIQSFYNGGPGGVVFGFLFVWLGTMSTFTVIGELASMAPIAGGQYYWVFLLAPKSCRKILSYLTGWMTLAGWQATAASSTYLVASVIQSLMVFTRSDYEPKPWQAVLIYWAVVLVALFFNIVASWTLATFGGTVLVFHLFGFLAVLIPMVYLGPHGSPSIYTEFLNEGSWSSQGLSFMVGLSGSAYTLLGADSAVHLSEEINDASLVVPRALIIALLINGVLGFGMVLAFIICIGDVDAMLASTKTLTYPFIGVFGQATGSVAGSTVMSSIIVAMAVCGSVGGLASASRVQWSFARDRGLPLWRTLVLLDPRTSIPIYSVALTIVISVVLSFVTLGSSIAFNDLVSLSVSGLYSSYFICCSLLLWRRCKGDIRPENDSPSRESKPRRLIWGRWRINGPIGIVNNAVACAFLIVMLIFSFWPPETPVVSTSRMNFSSVMFSVVFVSSLLWYLFRARKTYTGPVVET